jgi:hypothetical protein
MYRLIARALLVLLLMGSFIPLAVAATQPAPHACCMRKPMHDSSSQVQLHSLGCDGRSCCRGLVIPHGAQAAPATSCTTRPHSAARVSELPLLALSFGSDPSHSGRAPPAL